MDGIIIRVQNVVGQLKNLGGMGRHRQQNRQQVIVIN
jgi:hypothetical protein